ncbi:protein Ycf2-like [Aplysia californica]|uniref:Protein Ycf2-like n=1 Tax=Aplysia californica TaxID=6500 RepID=A0ABM1VVE6_APLCA|nr:protein Ycf2-like [Aplysia californica]
MMSTTSVLFIVALSVAMATAAPLASQKQASELVDQSDDTVDRAKRAQETIYYGNQQNKARVLAKKSDISNILSDSQLEGEVDQSGQVVAHEQIPVEEDLAARAEAALGKEEEDEKMAEAMESAMQSAVEAALNENDNGGDDSDSRDDESSDDSIVEGESPAETMGESMSQEDMSKESNEEDRAEEEEEETQTTEGEREGEEGEESEEMAEDEKEQEEDEDTEEKDLQEAAESSSAVTSPADTEGVVDGESAGGEEGEEEQGGETEGGSEAADKEDEQMLQEISEAEDNGVFPYETVYGDADETEEDHLPMGIPSDYNDQGQSMYDQLMMSPYGAQDLFQPIPYLYYRRRRSPSLSSTRHVERSRRRIKRDLLDDNYGIPYAFYPSQYPEERSSDAYDDDVDSTPLSEAEVEYMYKLFLTVLAENYAKELAEEEEAEEAEEEAEEGRRSPYEEIEEEQVPLRPEYIPESEDVRDRAEEEALAAYLPEDVLAAYGQQQRYGAFDRPLETEEEYRPEDKRSMMDYYPGERMDKRYFFPFSDEPQTHWGAFVPEKRDYGDAIQRLQRLALALSDSDSEGSSFGNQLEGYEKK